ITKMLLFEYGVLGSLAGIVGSLGAVGLTWGVSRYALDIPWRVFAGEHVGGVFLTAALVAVIGVLASLDVLRHKPLATLRAEYNNFYLASFPREPFPADRSRHDCTNGDGRGPDDIPDHGLHHLRSTGRARRCRHGLRSGSGGHMSVDCVRDRADGVPSELSDRRCPGDGSQLLF